MIHVSTEFKELMRERTDFRCYAELTLADGRELTLGAGDFTMVGNSVTDGAGTEGLPLGAAVCRTVRLSLANRSGALDGYDFFGARARLYLTFALSETEERVELGTFTVTEPESRGETVTVTAADDMYRADRAYTTALSYPATLGAMFREICDGCGIPYSTAAFPNSDLAVTAAPGEGYTCRQMLGYIAMLAGGNARVHRDGRMEILSYDPAGEPEHKLVDWIGLSADTDDVTVTGLETPDGTGAAVREGAEGYVLAVENPLLAGQEARALAAMGRRLIGLRVRRFSGEYIAYPLAEFMDRARVRDRKGNAFTTVITDVTFAFGGRTALSDSAASAVRNAGRYATPETKVLQAARQLAAAERTAREAAVEALNERLAKASGMYGTRQVQPDGSSVWYLHDKPTLKESSAVMKLTGDAIGFSTDGGNTYPFGFTVTGEMIMGVIRSEGISADWVKVGQEGLGTVLEGFVGRDENNQIVSMLNASADQINITGNRFVLDSDNFKVAADGTVTARNGQFTGKVNADAFTLQGANISIEEKSFGYGECDGNVEGFPENHFNYGQMMTFDADQGIYLKSMFGENLFAKKVFIDTKLSALSIAATEINSYNISERGTALRDKYLGIHANAESADKLAFAWEINGVPFDGTQNITVYDNTKLPLTGGTLSGKLYANAGIRATAVETTDPHGFRSVYGSYGTFMRNDGTNVYCMITNKNDQYGSWRDSGWPYYYDLATGRITFPSGVTASSMEVNSSVWVKGELAVDGNLKGITPAKVGAVDANKVRYGHNLVSVSGGQGTLNINFTPAMPAQPEVFLTANATSPGNGVHEVSVTGVSASGFTICIGRTGDYATTVHWFAICA